MNNEIKEIREYIACPEFGDDHYGKWGALRLDQRIKIKQLLDYITNLQCDIDGYKTKYKNAKENLKNLQEENKEMLTNWLKLNHLVDKLNEENETLQAKLDLYTGTLHENNKLVKRIDKAIEYLENTPKVVKSVFCKDKDQFYVFIENTVKQALLDILEGNNE